MLQYVAGGAAEELVEVAKEEKGTQTLPVSHVAENVPVQQAKQSPKNVPTDNFYPWTQNQ